MKLIDLSGGAAAGITCCTLCDSTDRVACGELAEGFPFGLCRACLRLAYALPRAQLYFLYEELTHKTLLAHGRIGGSA